MAYVGQDRPTLEGQDIVVGEAFGGRLPDGVRVSTKCHLGNPPPGEVLARLRTSLSDSLARMKLERVDLFFLHNMIVADGQIDLVQHAEQQGFESAWVCETRLVRDAVTPLAAFATVTQRIKLATGVVNNWTRTSGLMAMTLATLHELSGGRVMMGIGACWNPLAHNQGIRRRKTLSAFRPDF